MALVRRRRNPVVRRETKNFTQMRIDYIMIGLSHPIRVSVLKFLNRAMKNGDAMQPFSAIQHAIESINPRILTSDLSYHLAELKKVKFIEQLNGAERVGYVLTELGRKLVEVYFELEGIHDELAVLQPNVLDTHVYKNRIMELTRPCKEDTHVTRIVIEPRKSETPVDKFLTDHLHDADKPRPTRRKGTSFSSLDTFK